MATRTLSRRSARAEEPQDQNDDRLNPEGDDEPPRRARSRGAARSEEAEEAPRGRRGRSEDSETSAKPNSTGRGWKSFKEKRASASDFAKNYKLPEQEEIIKILDDEPFSVYAEHWLDEITSGKRSFVCIGDNCPLCDIGDKPRVYAMFNIVDLSDPEDPKVFPWKVSQTTADVLENYASDAKTSPINRDDLYFSVYKSGGGKKGRVQVHVRPVKARDLLEDWDIDPLTTAELDDFELLEEENVLSFSSRAALKEIADSLD